MRWAPVLVFVVAPLLTGLHTGCVAGCPRDSVGPAAAEDARALVARVLDDWHDAAAKADLQRYFNHLAEDAIFLGTDATERWTKGAFLAFARPHFAKGKAWTFRATRRAVVIPPGGGHAFFDEDLETLGLGPARGSGVLALRGGRWTIVHYNLTLTVPNDRFALARDAAGAAKVLAAEEGVLDPVTFLSGSWVATTPGGQVEEHWTHAAGGTLLGVGRTTAGDRTKFFESLRIEAREGVVVYVAQPRGGAATEFVLAKGSPRGKLVFENAAHDYPKRISYELADGRIRVQVAGGPGQPVEAWVLERAVVQRGK